MCRNEITFTSCHHTEIRYYRCRIFFAAQRERASIRQRIVDLLTLTPRTPALTEETCPAQMRKVQTSRKCDVCIRKDERRRVVPPISDSNSNANAQANPHSSPNRNHLAYTAAHRQHTFNLAEGIILFPHKEMIWTEIEARMRDLESLSLRHPDMQIQKTQELDAMLEKARYTYLCIRCLGEGRESSARERAVNSGFCCARGVDEWEAEFGPLVKGVRESFLVADGSVGSPSGQNNHEDADRERDPNATFVPKAGENLFPEEIHLPSPSRSGNFRPERLANKSTYIPSAGENIFPAPSPSPRESVLAFSLGSGFGINMEQYDSPIRTDHGSIPSPPHRELPATPSCRFSQGDGVIPVSAPESGIRRGETFPDPPTRRSVFSRRPLPPTPQLSPHSTSLNPSEPFLRTPEEGISQTRSRLPLPTPSRDPNAGVPSSLGFPPVERAHTSLKPSASLTRSNAIRRTNSSAANSRRQPDFEPRRTQASRTIAGAAKPSRKSSGKREPQQPTGMSNPLRKFPETDVGHHPPFSASSSSKPRQPQVSKTGPNQQTRAISPVSSTNSHWDDVLPSSPSSIAREIDRPVSPLTRAPSQSREPRPNQRTHAQSQAIQNNRKPKSVMSKLGEGIDEALDVWTGPEAMTRTEKRERVEKMRQDQTERKAREEGFKKFGFGKE